jgi:hypothetical protein
MLGATVTKGMETSRLIKENAINYLVNIQKNYGKSTCLMENHFFLMGKSTINHHLMILMGKSNVTNWQITIF